MTSTNDSGNVEIPHLVHALLGRVAPGRVRDAWADREFAFRLQTHAASRSSTPPADITEEAVAKVFAHPAVGSMARAESAASPQHWAPVDAALRVLAGDDAGAVAVLRERDVPAGAAIHLPGAAKVCDPSTGTMHALKVVGGLELNNIEPAFTAWSDHVESEVTADWCALVRDATALIAELDNPDFANVTTLTTVVVPLLQRDGEAFGRSSKVEIESGSLTEAIGMAYISPGAGDPASFAEAMVHESYHNLFNMALHIAEFELENSAEFYAPWKGMTRPTHAVLHGIVAFSSVMRFWLHLSHTHGDWSTHAHILVERRAAEVLQSATAVLAAGVLSEVGEELVEEAAADARAAS